MDLVNDDPPDRAEMFFHPLPDQNSLECLRGRDHYVWWAFRLASSCTDWSVSMSDLYLDVEILSHLLESAEKVSVERPEWGYVEYGDSARFSFCSGLDEFVEYGEDGCECLPCSGWCAK